LCFYTIFHGFILDDIPIDGDYIAEYNYINVNKTQRVSVGMEFSMSSRQDSRLNNETRCIFYNAFKKICCMTNALNAEQEVCRAFPVFWWLSLIPQVPGQ